MKMKSQVIMDVNIIINIWICGKDNVQISSIEFQSISNLSLPIIYILYSAIHVTTISAICRNGISTFFIIIFNLGAFTVEVLLLGQRT